jgi:hypothetical protein
MIAVSRGCIQRIQHQVRRRAKRSSAFIEIAARPHAKMSEKGRRGMESHEGVCAVRWRLNLKRRGTRLSYIRVRHNDFVGTGGNRLRGVRFSAV